MSPRQLIVLAIAALAAIAAVFTGLHLTAPPPAPTEQAVAVEGQQVLVITRDMPQGTVLQASDLEWRGFSAASIGASFVQETSSPEALTEYVGAVARRAFAAGEPVIQGAVIQKGAQGVLAAQLPPGYRAVAIEVSEVSSVGGFIQPNDRVDVILTTTREGSGAEGQDEVLSDVILEDVRVLTVGPESRPVDTEEGAERISADTAVLELTQRDARTIALASELGTLRLALRGVEAEPPQMDVPSAQRWKAEALEQRSEEVPPVRVHAYGTVVGAR